MSMCGSPSSVNTNKKNGEDWLFSDVMNDPLVSKKDPEIDESEAGSEQFLKDHEMEMVWKILEHQGWTRVCQRSGNVNPTMVKKFYEQLRFTEVGQILVGEFVINGVKESFTSKELSAGLGVPHDGRKMYIQGKWPSEYSRDKVLTRITSLPRIPHDEDITNDAMGSVNRVIHTFIKDNVVPCGGRKDKIGIIDAVYVLMLVEGRKLHLPWIMCKHMEYIRATPMHALAYASSIKMILKRAGLYQEFDHHRDDPSLNLGAMRRLRIDSEEERWVPAKGKQEEAWSREVCSIKEEQANVIKDMKEIKALLKDLLDAGTS